MLYIFNYRVVLQMCHCWFRNSHELNHLLYIISFFIVYYFRGIEPSRWQFGGQLIAFGSTPLSCFCVYTLDTYYMPVLDWSFHIWWFQYSLPVTSSTWWCAIQWINTSGSVTLFIYFEHVCCLGPSYLSNTLIAYSAVRVKFLGIDYKTDYLCWNLNKR